MPLSTSSGGLSELSEGTKKQKEMARSVTPTNNFQGNGLSPEKAGVVKEKEYQEVTQKAGQPQDFATQKRTAQTGAGLAPVAGLQENLGSFNLRLQAQVNAFLNGQTMSNANTKLVSGGTPVYNASTGLWEAPKETLVEANTEGLTADKLAQQKDLQSTAGDMFQDGKPKSFEEVLKKFGDRNNDGVIDAAEQQWLNEAFDIVNNLRRLKNTPSGTAEYEALRMQLAQKDKNGMVAGLLDAMDEYEKIAGMKVTGADADAYYLRDLLTMSQDQIGQEVQKALSQSSGLFGADYEAYVKREFDKSARQYNEAAREDATVMQKIKEVSNAWLKDFETQFESGRVQLNQMFKSAADKLIQDLKKAADEARASGTEEGVKQAKGIEQAQQWFVDTQTLVNSGSKDFGSIVFQALVDSRLGAEPKRILKHWLGRTIGEDVAEKGVLAQLMDQISNTGYFWTENELGQQVQVSFDARQKMDIVRMMNDRSMPDAEKIDRIESMISQASQGMGQRLETDLGKVIGPIQSGQLQGALNTWEGAMANSMKGFTGSLVQTGYTAAVQSMGRQNAPQVMQAAIEQKAQQKLDEINKAYTEVAKTLTDKQAQIQKDASTLVTNIDNVQKLNATGIQSVQKDYKDAMTNYMTSAMTPSTMVNGVKQSALEIAYRNMMVLTHNYNWTRTQTGQEVADVQVPADINSEKYAKAYSAVQMMKNLRKMDSNEYPQYQILLRDFLGGGVITNAVLDKAAVTVDTLLDNPGLIFHPDNAYFQTAMKIADALTNPKYAEEVWANSPNSKALADNLKKNNDALAASQKKLTEAEEAYQRLNQSMEKARQTLGAQAAQATQQAAQHFNALQETVQLGTPQQAPGLAADSQNDRNLALATQSMLASGTLPQGVLPPQLVGAWQDANRRVNAGYAAMDKYRGRDFGVNWQATPEYAQYRQAEADLQNINMQIEQSLASLPPQQKAQISAGTGSQPPTMNLANSYNQDAPPTPATIVNTPMQAPLTANISGETANNMFNQALDGTTMQFTRVPEVDVDAMRKLGNVQYVPSGAGLDPSTYGQYVQQKWVPSAAEIAIASPMRDVQGGGQPQVKPPQTPATKIAESIRNSMPPIGDHAKEPERPQTSPIANSYQVSSKEGGVITVNQHQDGTWSGKYPDGRPLDQTALDEIGATTPGSNTVYSGAVGENAVPVKDVLDKIAGMVGKETPNATAAKNAESFSDGKVAAATGQQIDQKRLANDPAYAAGVQVGVEQRNLAIQRMTMQEQQGSSGNITGEGGGQSSTAGRVQGRLISTAQD